MAAPWVRQAALVSHFPEFFFLCNLIPSYGASLQTLAMANLYKASAHLSSFDTKDLHQEVVAPAADSSFHGEAVFAGMLFQQR